MIAERKRVKQRVTKASTLPALEKQIDGSLNVVRVAELAFKYADEALGQQNTNLFMATLCVSKARVELDTAKMYLAKAKKGRTSR